VTDRDRTDSGQFTSDTIYTERDFLAAVDGLDHPTTSDIADRVGCSHDTASRWLRQLETESEIKSQRIGNSVVWSQSVS